MNRDSSRTPRSTHHSDRHTFDSAETQLRQVRGERRGGKDYKRRLKAICLTYLEKFLEVVQALVRYSSDIGVDPPESVDSRRVAAETAHNWVKHYNWLPGRGEPLLPRDTSDDLDSNIAESVWASDEEEDLPPDLPQPLQVRLQQLDLANTRVTSENVLLRRGVWADNRASSSSATASAPASSSTRTAAHSDQVVDVEEEEEESSEAWIDWDKCESKKAYLFTGDGIQIYPDKQLRFDNSSIISVDFHQVLDIHRAGRNTERPDEDGKILPRNLDILKELAARFTVFVCSYVHSDYRFEKVLEACRESPHIHYILVCQGDGPVGYTGKLSCLGEIVSPEQSLLHIDDNIGVCQEFDSHWNPAWTGVCTSEYLGKGHREEV